MLMFIIVIVVTGCGHCLSHRFPALLLFYLKDRVEWFFSFWHCETNY